MNTVTCFKALALISLCSATSISAISVSIKNDTDKDIEHISATFWLYGTTKFLKDALLKKSVSGNVQINNIKRGSTVTLDSNNTVLDNSQIANFEINPSLTKLVKLAAPISGELITWQAGDTHIAFGGGDPKKMNFIIESKKWLGKTKYSIRRLRPFFG